MRFEDGGNGVDGVSDKLMDGDMIGNDWLGVKASFGYLKFLGTLFQYQDNMRVS